MPADAQYAESAADVSPVDAHPTADRLLSPFLRMRFTCETSTVMPRSLNDPVCVFPHCFTHRSVMPSNMETMSSSSIPGRIHSFLDHTPEPYGHDVFPTRSSKSAFQYSGP